MAVEWLHELEPLSPAYELLSLRQRIGLAEGWESTGRPAVCVRPSTIEAARQLVSLGVARWWREELGGREILVVEQAVRRAARA